MSDWAKRNKAGRFSNPPPATMHAEGAPFRTFYQETRENRRNSRFSLEWSVRNFVIIFSASRTNERSQLGSSQGADDLLDDLFAYRSLHQGTTLEQQEQTSRELVGDIVLRRAQVA